MAKQKKELNFKMKKLNLTSDGNTSVILAVTLTQHGSYTAYVYAVQKLPNVAVLMYRWDAGAHADHEVALAAASENLADRFRNLITLTLGERDESI